jgi:formate C-acetyltransferase
VLLNQKLNPATLENESDKQKLMVLLRTFFEVHKGWHIQYNIVSRETLLEAKKHPDQYRDLVVRVQVLGVLHRPVAGCAGRYYRPYRAYAVINPGAGAALSRATGSALPRVRRLRRHPGFSAHELSFEINLCSPSHCN